MLSVVSTTDKVSDSELPTNTGGLDDHDAADRPTALRSCPMKRVRISATVDGERLRMAAELAGATGSALLDQALAALVEQLAAQREIAALEQQPYDADPDLAWQPPPGPALVYDGDIPADVVALAQARRRASM